MGANYHGIGRFTHYHDCTFQQGCPGHVMTIQSKHGGYRVSVDHGTWIEIGDMGFIDGIVDILRREYAESDSHSDSDGI